MTGAAITRTAGRCIGGLAATTARPRLVAGVVALALVAAGCGSAKDLTKAGARLVQPQTLNLSMPPGNGPPGAGGDFTPAYSPGRKLFHPGSSFIIWNTLQGSGLTIIYCVIARAGSPKTFWCTNTYKLPRGQIVADGDFDNSPDGDSGTIPVVGGSGAYAGAHGTVTTEDDVPVMTIHLR